MDSISTVDTAGLPPTAEPMWRLGHLGRHLGRALQRFDARVLDLMTADVDAPLALSNLAARRQIGAAHIHVMRHLPLAGERLTVLAQRADMSKQAMGDLLDQCVAWGLVERKADHTTAGRGGWCSPPWVASGWMPLAAPWRRPSKSSGRWWARTWPRWWCWAWRPMPRATDSVRPDSRCPGKGKP